MTTDKIVEWQLLKKMYSFKTVNGKEACVTVSQSIAKLMKGVKGFKTVNGKEACVTVGYYKNDRRIYSR